MLSRDPVKGGDNLPGGFLSLSKVPLSPLPLGGGGVPWGGSGRVNALRKPLRGTASAPTTCRLLPVAKRSGLTCTNSLAALLAAAEPFAQITLEAFGGVPSPFWDYF